jgi:hypothetical protein
LKREAKQKGRKAYYCSLRLPKRGKCKAALQSAGLAPDAGKASEAVASFGQTFGLCNFLVILFFCRGRGLLTPCAKINKITFKKFSSADAKNTFYSP